MSATETTPSTTTDTDPVMGIVERQFQENDPPQARAAYYRLLEQNIPDPQIRDLIRRVVLIELADIMTKHKPFNQERYVHNLDRLPKLPWE